MFDVPKTFKIKNCIILETSIFHAWKKIITSENFDISRTDQFVAQKNNFQAAMEITTNLQLEGMPDKDKAQVLIQSYNVWTLISNSERGMIDEAMI